tara:strand:- start:18 stop:557 length:540 start_codon:yes stop_codon:yes gene_type:complete
MKFKVFRFDKVKSTNNTAIRIIKSYNFDFGMIIADMQNNGRGQYGKKWFSYKGNLFVSFFYNLSNFKISLSKLTKINCILVKKCISKYYKKKIYFKKPNDLIIQKKKLCGILQEEITRFNNTYLVVGIGINLVKSPIIKNYPTTYLRNLINKDIPKKKFEFELKKTFENNLKRLIKKRV